MYMLSLEHNALIKVRCFQILGEGTVLYYYGLFRDPYYFHLQGDTNVRNVGNKAYSYMVLTPRN